MGCGPLYRRSVRDIPWHVTAFHKDYKMTDPITPIEDPLRAAEIGQEAGLEICLRREPTGACWGV